MKSGASAGNRWLFFVLAVLVCHNWWPILSPFGELLDGTRVNQYVDLVTPVAVVGTAAWCCVSGRMNHRSWALFGLAAIAYVEGHGIHLAANDISNQDPVGAAKNVAHFWDESFSHTVWYLGWIGLITLVIQSSALKAPLSVLRIVAGLLLGFTLFTNAVEGGFVAFMFAFNLGLALYCWRRRQGLRLDGLLISVVSLVLLTVFGVWQGGFPEFSQLGWL